MDRLESSESFGLSGLSELREDEPITLKSIRNQSIEMARRELVAK